MQVASWYQIRQCKVFGMPFGPGVKADFHLGEDHPHLSLWHMTCSEAHQETTLTEAKIVSRVAVSGADHPAKPAEKREKGE